MSKPWKPGRQTVELSVEKRPSRIRRDPVRLDKTPEVKPDSPEVEIWSGVIGILLFGAAIAAATIGVSAATTLRDDPAADARAAQFGQCYNAEGPNCVVDGDTIRAAAETITIAGLAAPGIQNARCDTEHSRGVEAAVRLANLLNSGPVTMSAPFRDPYGRSVRKVEVMGRDIAQTMIAADVARNDDGTRQNWCG
jgi:endonuclease YncB( thermonuclease family)